MVVFVMVVIILVVFVLVVPVVVVFVEVVFVRIKAEIPNSRITVLNQKSSPLPFLNWH